MDPFFQKPVRFVVYPAGQDWRYAVYMEQGIVDGRVQSVHGGDRAAQAKAALTELVESWSGTSLRVIWSLGDQPDWWTGDVERVEI